jgi:hypothetical protein
MSKDARQVVPPALTLDARLSGWRLWTGIVLSPPLIAMCVVLMVTLWRRHGAAQLDEFRLAVFCLLFALLALLLAVVFFTFIREVRTRTALLHIDRTSIHDRRLTRDAITWGEVRALQPVTYNAQYYLAILVDDAATHRAGTTWLWALNRRAARLQKRPELSVNLSMLDIDPQRVLDLLQQIVPEKMRAPVTQWRIPLP